jgi:hypothetical protein
MKRTFETDGMAARKRKRLKMKRRNKHDFQMKNRTAPRPVNFFCASCAFSWPWLCLPSCGWMGLRQSVAGQSDPKPATIGRRFRDLCNYFNSNHLQVKRGRPACRAEAAAAKAGQGESKWIQAVQAPVTLTHRRIFFEEMKRAFILATFREAVAHH